MDLPGGLLLLPSPPHKHWKHTFWNQQQKHNKCKQISFVQSSVVGFCFRTNIFHIFTVCFCLTGIVNVKLYNRITFWNTQKKVLKNLAILCLVIHCANGWDISLKSGGPQKRDDRYMTKFPNACFWFRRTWSPIPISKCIGQFALKWFFA